MSNKNSVVGIYKTHTEAEAAVKELQKSGRLSLTVRIQR